MLRRVLADSAIYGLGSLLVRAVALITLPLFTRLLSPQDYGAWDMLQMLGVFAQLLIGVELIQAAVRYIAAAKTPAERTAYAATALWVSVGLYTLGSGLLYAAALPLATHFLGDAELAGMLRLSVLWVFFSGVFMVLQNQARAEQKPVVFVVMSALNVGVSVVAALYALMVLDSGLTGVVLGYALGAAAGFGYGLYALRGSLAFAVDRQKLKQMLVFSLPLIPSTAAIFGHTYVDRIAINTLMTLQDVGVYGVAFRVASLLQLVLFAFQTAFLPIVFQRADAPETKDQLARVFTYFCLFCFSAIAVLALFRQEVFHFLIGADFAAATAYVPALLGAAFFAGVYVFFPGLMLSGKTTKIAQINIAGLSANLLLNMVLIPLYGLHGAACATLAAAAMTAGIYYKVAAASYPAPYRFGALGLAGGVTVLAVYLAEALNPFGLSYIGMGYKALVCATITMGLLLALVPADLRRVAAFLRRRLT